METKVVIPFHPQKTFVALIFNFSRNIKFFMAETTEQVTNQEAQVDENTNVVEQQVTNEVPELTDAQIAALFEKKFNFKGNIEEVTQKLNYTPPAPIPSDEERQKQEQALDNRMLETYLRNGGKAEDYIYFKQVAFADVAELSQRELRAELKAHNFSDSEIDQMIKERYYQFTDEELEQFDDETDKAFALRKKEYAQAKLANRSSYKKAQAADILNTIKEAISQEDLQKQTEVEFSSKVDEHISKMPRKITFELGNHDGQKLDPITYDVSESDIAEITETLKNPAKRKDVLFDKNGQINVANVAQLMVRNKIFENAVKTGLLEGQTRQVREFEKVFPARTASEVGVGGAQVKTSSVAGKPVRRGEARPVSY